MKFDNVHSVIKELRKILAISPATEFSVVRSDENAERPEYPFGSYKILVLTQDPKTSASGWLEPKDDQEFYDVTRKNEQATISLTFLHNKSLASCFSQAQKAMNWFDSNEGMAKCEEFEITPQVASGDISDRTVVLDGVQIEYKAGFDVIFKSRQVEKVATKKTASAPKTEYQEG